MKKVAIIGGSGFIGSYVTKRFLQAGYQAKVSVTDLSKKEKYQHLFDLPNSNYMEIKELDVQHIDALKQFLQGCEIIVHGGTPFQLNVEDPKKDLMDPTIQGTENFLKLVSEIQEIKKIVFIASVAAYNTIFPLPVPTWEKGQVCSESDTPYLNDEAHPYAQAKYYAHQTIQKFIAENPNMDAEIVSVAPVFVVGKSMSGRQDSTSTGMQYLLKNKIAPDPFVQMFFDQNVDFAMVAVEDVADTVFQAATKKGLHGRTYLATGESWKVSDITLMLNKQKPEGSASTVYSNQKAVNELGIQFKPAYIPLNQYD